MLDYSDFENAWNQAVSFQVPMTPDHIRIEIDGILTVFNSLMRLPEMQFNPSVALVLSMWAVDKAMALDQSTGS